MDIHNLSQGELIEILGISRPTVVSMGKEDPPLPSVRENVKNVKYDLHKVIPWLMDRAVRKAGLGNRKRQEVVGIPALDDSEARKAAADAAMAELKLARERGHLLDISDYEHAWAVRIARHREGMASIKSRIRARVGPEVAEIVDQEIRAVLGAMDQVQLPEGA
jgi:phage terminase Nu1 subunit (DNA packaging protein)